jgi:hypothetical protein
MEDELQKYLKIIFMTFFVVMAFSFNSSVFISLPVLERETHLKYALTVMGCRVLPYWMGTFVFDYILYYIFVLIFIIFSYTLNLTFITDYMGVVVYIFTTLGLSIVSFAYMIGLLLFKNTSSAQKFFPLFNFFVVYTVPFCVWGLMV